MGGRDVSRRRFFVGHRQRMTPDLTNDCRTVARELLAQPDLLAPVFSEEPESGQELIHAAGRYTGERSTKDEQRLLLVGALRLLGASDREIERQAGVTRRTIPLLLAELEKSGRITPLKERLSTLTGDNAERSQLALRRLLDRATDGECDAELASMIKSVSVACGVTAEKVLLLTGQATEIIETRAAAGRAEFEDWWRAQVRDVTPPGAADPAAATNTAPIDSRLPAATNTAPIDSLSTDKLQD